MFVTFFLGILDIETGHLEYCNAGHNPPLIYTPAKGFYYFYEDKPFPPLGILKDMNYAGGSLSFSPGDIFFLYTDGITEAMDPNNVQFSEKRLLEVLSLQDKNEAVSNITNSVKAAVEQHAAGTMQSDDITIFVFRYNGRKRQTGNSFQILNLLSPITCASHFLNLTF